MVHFGEHSKKALKNIGSGNPSVSRQLNNNQSWRLDRKTRQDAFHE